MVISKSFIYQSNIIKFFFVFLILMISILFLIQIRNGVIHEIENKKISVKNIEVILKLDDESYIDDIEKSKYVKSIEKYSNNDEYIVIIDNYDNVDMFLDKNKQYYSDVMLFDNDKENKIVKEVKILDSLEVGLTYLIAIFIVISIILSIIIIVEVNLENVNVISFYKLVGYKNLSIIKFLFNTLLFIYIFLLGISILVNNIITFILINLFNNSFFEYLDFSIYLYMFLFVLLFLVLTLTFSYFKIFRITPIQFKNKNFL